MRAALVVFSLAAVAALAAVSISSLRDRVAIADEIEGAVHGVLAETHYRRLCLPCHGTNGAGDGPAAPWLWPTPRDLTKAQYKWRSTDVGKAPLAEDLARVIRYGVPGTSMHGFGESLSSSEIDALVEKVQRFAPDTFATPAPAIKIAPRPTDDADFLEKGKAAYTELGCDKCHGDGGKGDGPSAKGLTKPDGTPETTYDLTKHSFRRPRSASDDPAEMIMRSLVTGLAGTPMPSFSEAAPPEKLWALSVYVASLTAPLSNPLNRSIAVAPEAAAADTVRSGYWPGTRNDPDAVVWGHSIELQGEPPANLAPAQASLSVEQCARCHAAQYRDWRKTVHASAVSPGLMAQLVELEHDTNDASNGSFVEGCLRCHAPLAEQQATLPPERLGGDNDNEGGEGYVANAAFDSELQSQAISCAGCHVRKWTRHGPPHQATKLLPSNNYPDVHSDFYERSDFCLACHQLAPSNLLGDKPLLNTYREWLAGPYFAKGIQCQHCHMSNREHAWKGVHDPETFRQGIKVSALTVRDGDQVSVRVRIENVGAGHYLPTTPTPAAFVDAELVDAAGRAIPGASASRRIGRHIRYDDEAGWIEVEDSRIPPGEHLELAATWKDGRVAAAAELVVTVRVEPDEYYERMYAGELKSEITARQRRMYTEALALAKGSHFIALTKRFVIGE